MRPWFAGVMGPCARLADGVLVLLPHLMPEVPVDADGNPTGSYMWSEDEYNSGNGGWVFLAFEGG